MIDWQRSILSIVARLDFILAKKMSRLLVIFAFIYNLR